MEECLDVLTEDGSATGNKKLKSEVHRDGDWHRSVHVWFINSKKELLLQLRSPQKINFPNLWDISAAGHISAGETPEAGAIREVKEELGVDILPADLVKIGTVTNCVVINGGSFIENEYNEVYLVQEDIEPQEFDLQMEEVAAVRWCQFEECERDMVRNPSSYVPHSKEQKLLFNFLRKTLG